jgi:putative hydrolase of the HAD superfamily
LHRIRAITLDLDDTLWEITPVIRRAEAALWSWLGENFPKIPEAFSPEAAYGLREEVMTEHQDRNHDFRFMRKMVLKRMAATVGYSPDFVALIAVTNGNANLQRIGIRHLFHDVVTAVDVGAAKPARPIFDEAVSRADVAAQQTLHVGDHPEIDIAGAQDAGLRTAWINRNGDDWPEHVAAPDAIISTIAELLTVLEPAIAHKASESAHE